MPATCRSGCLGKCDGVPECLQLPDMVAYLLARVDAAGVIASAEVVVAGGGGGEEVPDDDQDGARRGELEPGDRAGRWPGWPRRGRCPRRGRDGASVFCCDGLIVIGW